MAHGVVCVLTTKDVDKDCLCGHGNGLQCSQSVHLCMHGLAPLHSLDTRIDGCRTFHENFCLYCLFCII